MDLPSREGSFDFSHVGELTGKKYEGQFTCKCVLSLGDKRLLEIEKARLTADLMNPTGNLSALGSVVANLRVRIIDAPDWFNQSIMTLDILDEEVVFEIYTKCLDKADEWVEKVKGKSQEADKKEGNEQKES